MNIIKTFALIISLFISYYTFSQAPCAGTQNTFIQNGDFNAPTTGNHPINGDVPGWFTSHGSPDVLSSNTGILMWSRYVQGGNSVTGIWSEGIFSCYNLDKNKQYEICLQYTSVGSGSLIVKATTGLTEQYLLGTGQPIANVSPSTEEVIGTTNVSTSTPTNLTFTYNPSQDFTQLWIYPNNPETAQQNVTVDNIRVTEIVPCSVKPSMIISQKEPCVFNFDAQVLTNSHTQVTNYVWDFGDNYTATGQNVSHQYAQPGVYTVTLTVTGVAIPGGCSVKGRFCSTTIQKEIKMKSCDPEPCIVKPDFSYGTGGQVSVYGQYYFTDLTSSNSNIISWLWDFGDGNTSTSPNPVHTYAQPGIYSVCLSVVSSNGRETCCNKICKKLPFGKDSIIEKRDKKRLKKQ